MPMEASRYAQWQGAVGIVGAIESEVVLLESALEDVCCFDMGAAHLVGGTLEGSKVIVARSGVGKVNAATSAQSLAVLGASSVINTGVAGAVGEGLRIGDYVVATSCIQHDFDVSHFGLEIGHIPGFPSKAFKTDDALRTALADTVTRKTGSVPFEGCIVSGDRFIGDACEKHRLSQAFGALCCDMEAAAIAQVCTAARIPFAVVRVVSDLADGSQPENYKRFETEAAHASAAIVQMAIRTFGGLQAHAL